MITVEHLELPFSSSRKGNIRFMEYQREVLESSEKVISINAPTGSGKTLAILKKGLDSIDRGNTALFLYPTNELLDDQFRSFVNLLKALNYHCGFINVENDNLKVDKAEVLVWPVNGQYLEYLARDRSKGSVIREVLLLPETLDSKLLILSNIDFLYNLVRGNYHRSELSLHDLIKTTSFIAVDELHMYWGTMFFSLLFSLKTLENKVDHIMISSATHTKTLNAIFSSLDSDNTVVEAKEGTGRIVRYETQLEFLSFTDEPYLSKEGHAEEYVIEAVKLFEHCKDLLCIVNSVVFAEKVARKIENLTGENVGKIHGFVPKEVRDEMRDRGIVVGTSSIEVGIDFDKEGLIFEANNAPTFLQRLGRIGRHREGVAKVILPIYDYKSFKKAVKSNNISFRDFERLIWRTLPVPRYYSELKNSESGVTLYLSYVSSLIYLLKRIYGRDDFEFEKLKEVYCKIKDFAASDSINPKIDVEVLKITLNKLLQKGKIRFAKEMITLSRIFPRGGIPFVPVFYKEYRQFSLISLNNLEKTEVEVIKAIDMEYEKPKWLRVMERLDTSVPVFIINDINFSNHLVIKLERSTKDVFQLKRNEFKVLSEWDEDVNTAIEDLIEGLPAYFVQRVPDWRFSHLRAKKGNLPGYVVLGGDAYICLKNVFT